MHIVSRLAGAALAATVVTAPAHALTYQLVTTIDGPQAGVASPATGSGTLTYDDASNNLAWDITYSGLLAPETISHFHGPAAPGVSAAPQITLPLGSPKVGNATLSETQEGQLLGGLWYVNIHSTVYPDGEIRGQVVAIPEPEVYAMLATGLGLVGLAVRRRKP